MTSSQPKSTPSHPNNLRVRMYWGDLLYDTILVPKGRDVSAGRDRHDTFVIPLDRKLSSGRWNFVRRHPNGEIEISFHGEQSGHIRTENRLIPLREAAKNPKATPAEHGLVRLRLEGGSEARLVSGDSSFYIDWVNDAPRIPRTGKETWRELGVTTAIGSGLLLLLAILPHVLPTAAPEPAPPERLVSIINEADFVAPIPEPAPPAPEAIAEPEVVEPVKPARRPKTVQIGKQSAPVAQVPVAPPEEEDVDLSGLVDGLTNVPSRTAAAPKAKVRTPIRAGAGRVAGGFGAKELSNTANNTVGLGATVGQGERNLSETGDVNLKSTRIARHGGLTQEEVDRVIRARQPSVRRCYERVLTTTPGLAGRMRVQFTVGAAGGVTQAGIAEDSIKHLGVTQCVLAEIKTFRFPIPDGGRPVAVDLPLRFEPDSN